MRKLLLASLFLAPLAAALPPFEPALKETSDQIHAAGVRFAQAEPRRQPGWRYVSLSIDQFLSLDLRIDEERLGLHIQGEKDMSNNIRYFGDLKARATPIFWTEPAAGYELDGDGGRVSLRRLGDARPHGYLYDGSYVRRPGGAPARVTFYVEQSFNGGEYKVWTGAADLNLRLSAFGWLVSGSVDPERFGKADLAWFAAAFGAVTSPAQPRTGAKPQAGVQPSPRAAVR